MANKVKPFYIRITDDMTPQIVQDAFDKCVDAGAVPDECVAGTNKKHKYQDSYGDNFNYLGTSCLGGTYLSDDCRSYGEDAQEITLDQLDKWLGLEVEQEWKNGDECIYQGKTWHFVSILSDEFHGTAVIFERVSEKLKQVDLSKLEKPETPEQKAERERLEAAYDLYCECVMHGNSGPIRFETFKSSHLVNLTWLRIVDKTSYRKK